MISFRFHLVSLVAVFLALGLGVLTGTTVLNRGIVEQLEHRTDQLAAQSAGLRETVERLEAEQAEWVRFAQTVNGTLLAGRLEDTEIVLVTQEGTDAAALEGIRDTLATAGARVPLQLSVSARLNLQDAEDLEVLADLVEVRSTAGAEEVADAAARELADQLSFGTVETDLVSAMEEAGFLVRQGAEASEPSPALQRAFVVVAGGVGEPELDPAAFLVPLVERIALNGQAVASAEPRRSEHEFVSVLRGGEVADRVVTQDNVEEIPGQIGLVLGLELLLSEGESGHYGVKAGATELLPQAP